MVTPRRYSLALTLVMGSTSITTPKRRSNVGLKLCSAGRVDPDHFTVATVTVLIFWRHVCYNVGWVQCYGAGDTLQNILGLGCPEGYRGRSVLQLAREGDAKLVRGAGRDYYTVLRFCACFQFSVRRNPHNINSLLPLVIQFL